MNTNTTKTIKETDINKVIKAEAIIFNEDKDLRNEENLAAFYDYLCDTYRYVDDTKDPIKEYDKKTGALLREVLPTKRLACYFSVHSGHAWEAFERTFDYSQLDETLKCLTHKPDVNKFVKSAAALMPNLNAYSVGSSLTNLRRFIENIYANYGVEGAKNQQVSLYQYSGVGGTGKSEFIKTFENFCKKNRISNGHSTIVGRWINSDFSKNKVSFITEFTPPNRYERDTTIENINNIIDNTLYKVESKGCQPILVQSQTSLIINSNFLPFDINDRRYGIVKYNEVPFNDIPQEYKDKYFKDTQNVEIVKDLFESCPFGAVFEDAVKVNKSSRDELIFGVRNVISRFPDADLIQSPRKIAEHISMANQETDARSRKDTYENVKSAIIKMVNEGILKPTTKVSSGIEYSKYSLQNIADLHTNEDDAPSIDLDNYDNEWDRTAAAYKKFLVEDNNTDPTDDDTRKKLDDDEHFTEDDVLKFKCFVKDNEYSEPSPAVKEDTQFIVTATPKTDYLKEVVANDEKVDAKGEHYLPVFFVYESDDLSLAEQTVKAEKLVNDTNYGKTVFSVTNSGHKSLHTLVYIDPAQREDIAKDFKYYWTEAAKMVYGSTDNLDKACASIARLSRLPGGKRDDGSYQKCVYMNRECEPLDMSSIITIHNKELEAEKAIRESKKTTYNNNKIVGDEWTKLENIHNTGNRSESFELAYDVVKNGCCPSGANYYGAFMSLKYMDFSADFVKTNFFDVVKAAHPTNLTKPFEVYWNK